MVAEWRRQRALRVATGQRLLWAALVALVACLAAMTYSVVGVLRRLHLTPTAPWLYAAAATGAVLFVLAVALATLGCRHGGRRPASTCIKPCCDSEAEVAQDLEWDEGVAEGVNLEFLSAVSEWNRLLSRRGIVVRHRWVVDHGSVDVRRQSSGDTGKRLNSSDLMELLLDEESGSFAEASAKGSHDSYLAVPFYPPDRGPVVVEWLQFLLPASVALTHAMAGTMLDKSINSSSVHSGSTVSTDRPRALPRIATSGVSTMSSISLAQELTSRSDRGPMDSLEDPTSCASSVFGFSQGIEADRALQAARLLAEDDVAGAVSALSEVLHPGVCPV
jgi:hypothetical protein